MLGNAEIMEHTRKPIDESDVVPNVCKLAYLIVYNEFFKVYFLWYCEPIFIERNLFTTTFYVSFFLHGTGQCIYIYIYHWHNNPHWAKILFGAFYCFACFSYCPPPNFWNWHLLGHFLHHLGFFFLLLSVIDFFVFTL